MTDAHNAEERYCHDMLARLRESHQRAAQPYIDRLVRIHAMRCPPILLPITNDELRAMLDNMPVRSGDQS